MEPFEMEPQSRTTRQPIGYFDTCDAVAGQSRNEPIIMSDLASGLNLPLSTANPHDGKAGRKELAEHARSTGNRGTVCVAGTAQPWQEAGR